MGGAFSCGENNDDLINILILLGYIKSKKVERVFRAVDRGDYVFPSHRDLAYKDLSWKLGNIHLSAPCVYCKVMEGLSLKPGLSFLNIGSGTGYLSTMAGLILGKNGTNHGIEMHEDCLIYAYEHLDVFKNKSLDVDSFEFCEPVFKLGNILNATPDRRYDRVYCGAACPENHEKYIKQFVKIGGILVMPYKDNLLRIERLDEDIWRNSTMLPVSFASLITPQDVNERGLLQLPMWQPCSLQEMCRSSIRCHLRNLVWSEHNDLVYRAPINAQSIERTSPQFHLGIPFFEESNRGQSDIDSSEAADSNEEDEAHFNDVVTSTLRLVRAVVQPNRGVESHDNNEQQQQQQQQQQRNADTSENSEETPENSNPASSTKEPTSHDAEMREDIFVTENHVTSDEDVSMDTEMIEKPNKIETAKRKSDKTSENRKTTDSKLKRKCEANIEPHSSQRYRRIDQNNLSAELNGDRAPATCSYVPTATISDSDDPVDDDALSISWIEHAFSLLKDKLEMEEDSDSSADHSEDTEFSTSEDSSYNDPTASSNDRADHLVHRESNDRGAGMFLCLLDDKTAENNEDNASNNCDTRANGSRDICDDKSPANLDNGRKSDDLGNNDEDEDEEEEEDTKILDKSNSGGEDSTSDEEINERSLKYRCGLRTRQNKKLNERRFENFGNNETCDNTRASDSSASSDTDPNFDFDLINQRSSSLQRNIYAHTVRSERISHFMRRKIGGLPLPLPLRLYVNYNREL